MKPFIIIEQILNSKSKIIKVVYKSLFPFEKFFLMSFMLLLFNLTGNSFSETLPDGLYETRIKVLGVFVGSLSKVYGNPEIIDVEEYPENEMPENPGTYFFISYNGCQLLVYKDKAYRLLSCHGNAKEQRKEQLKEQSKELPKERPKVFASSGINILIDSVDRVIDIDGNIYHTVKIGKQIWAVENLRTTKYNNGIPITLCTSTATWANATTGMFCHYNNTTNADSIKKFGALYNWYAINTGKLAPQGWHVPTDAEWDTLANYLIANGYNWDGTKDVSSSGGNLIAKSLAAKTDWHTCYLFTGVIGYDLTKNNRSSFSALPGGCRDFDGAFYAQSEYGIWWCDTELDADRAWTRALFFCYDYIFPFMECSKGSGFSVRLLRD